MLHLGGGQSSVGISENESGPAVSSRDNGRRGQGDSEVEDSPNEFSFKKKMFT